MRVGCGLGVSNVGGLVVSVLWVSSSREGVIRVWLIGCGVGLVILLVVSSPIIICLIIVLCIIKHASLVSILISLIHIIHIQVITLILVLITVSSLVLPVVLIRIVE